MIKKAFLKILGAILLIAVMPSGVLSANKMYKATITGYIYIVEKNETGEPVAIGIMVDKEYEIVCYHIENNEKTRELINHISHTIQVSGIVIEDKNGKKFIKVKSWKPAPIEI